MPEVNTLPKKKAPPVDPGALSVRIPPELREQLDDAADADDKSLGEFCREALEVVVNNPGRKLDQLVRALAICSSQVERAAADGTLNEHDAGELVEKLQETQAAVEGPRKGGRESWWTR